MATIDDNNALLLYRVGPVLCCAPCLPISAIIEPRPLTRPPGTSSGRPGIFKHANAIVSSLDLRYKFGVEEANWVDPGRTIVTHLDIGHIGFYVDEILDVITLPASGWGALPPLLPRGIFTRTLLLKDHIYLYAEFADLQRIPDSGYLRQYILHLLEAEQRQQQLVATQSVAAKPGAHHVTHNTDALHSTSATPSKSHDSTIALTNSRQPSQPTNARTLQGSKPVIASMSQHKSAVSQTNVSEQRQPQPAASKRHTPTPVKRVATNSAPERRTAKQADTVVPLHTQRSAPITTKPVATTHTPPAVPHTTRRTSTVSTATSDATSRATHQDTSSQQLPTHHNASSGTGGVAILLSLILLAFAGIGTTLWYVWFDTSNPLPVHSTVTTSPEGSRPQTVFAPSTDHAITEIAPAPATPVHAQPDVVTTVDTDTVVQVNQAEPTPVTPAPALAAAPPPQQNESVTDEKPPTATTTETATSQDNYHASIERDQDGLTITLEAPPDDPVFNQPAPVTPANTETATSVVDSESLATVTVVPDVVAQVQPKTTTPDTVEIIHIVVKGDTLWHIAKRYVNNPFRYPELARLSKIRNPDLIYPGNRVRILKRKRQP